MFWNRPRRSIQLKVILGLGLAVITVATVSFISYRSLSDLVETVKSASRPNKVVITVKDVMSDLSDAESSVRAYTITNEATYLSPYYSAISNIERKVVELKSLTNKDSIQRKRVDSISVLIENKFLILEDLLHIKKNGRLESTLQKVTDNIDRVKKEKVEKIGEENEEKEEKKGGFLRDLFRSESEKEKDAKIEDPKEEEVEEESKSIKDIEQAVETLKQKHREEADLQQKKELALTKKDKLVMDKIRSLLGKMESTEVERSKEKAEEASRKAAMTKNIITVFSTIAFVLLLTLGYIIINDIARSNRFRRLLSNAKSRAEKLARVKDEFLANMSHEIRTPIMAIVGFTEQLKKTKLDQEQGKYVKVIRSSSEHLLAIINDVLDHSKLESGSLRFEEVPFRFREVLSDVLLSFEEKASEKEVDLKEEVPEEIPKVLKGDPVRFKQILINLVGNALKFTEQGYVKVICRTEEKADDRLLLIVSVEDTGIGIPEEKLDKIFRNFNQVDTSTTRKYGGSGLGLSITKRLVELQKGRLEVDSEEGKGSVFTFRIPYGIGDESELHSTEEKEEQKKLSDLAGKKALVVDDEQYNRLLIKTVLEKWEMEVIDVADGYKAIDAVEAEAPDIVLMDLQMPEISGIEATKQIKQNEKGKNVPVIALTAGISKKEVEESYEAGMVGHLLKPFKEDDLYNKVLRILPEEFGIETFRDKDSKTEKKRNETAMAKEGPSSNFQQLYDLADGDQSFVKEMLMTFLRDSEVTMKELKSSMENGEVEQVGMKAHKLASPCRHLGKKDMSQNLKAIEEQCKEKGTLDAIQEEVNRELEKIENNAEG